MRALGIALVIMAAPAFAERPIDGWDPDERIRVEGPLDPQGLVPYNKIYLNRCANGCPISVGTSSSIADRWGIPAAATLTKFPYSDETWNKVVACFKDVMSPYNVEIVTTNPGNTNHFEIMIAGNPQDIGFAANIGGVAPGGCTSTYMDNALVFDFAGVWGSGTSCSQNCIEDICATAAQEIAHTWSSMDHVILREDPMTYYNFTGRKYFQNIAGQCGSDCVSGKGPGSVTCSGTNNQNHVCRCTGSTRQVQNSVEIIKGLFGVGPGTPPTVTIKNPIADLTLQPGFKVNVEASDDGGNISKVELKIDGTVIGTVMAPPYDFASPLTLTPGAHKIEAVAYDGPGTPGTAVINIQIGPPCESSEDCPSTTDVCAGGRCVAGPSVTGGLGSTCTDSAMCIGGICGTDGTSMYCAEPCKVGECPEEFGCIDDGSGMGTGVCWPGYDDGSGGCGCQSNQPGGALSFGLLFAVTVFTWRRRRSSVS